MTINPYFKLVMLFTVAFVSIFSVLAIPVAKAGELLVPLINVAPTEYYPLDETLYIEGQAPPKSKVELLFESIGSQPVRLIVNSNSDGGWSFSQKLELSSGEWAVRARTLADPPSNWSNPRIIQSKVTGFIFGNLKIKYLPIVVTLLILIIFSVVLLLYSLIKARNIKQLALEEKLREKEKQSSQIIIERDFADIRRKIVEELEHLDGRAKKGSLSQKEQEHHNELMKQLYQTEEEIKKNLGGGVK